MSRVTVFANILNVMTSLARKVLGTSDFADNSLFSAYTHERVVSATFRAVTPEIAK